MLKVYFLPIDKVGNTEIIRGTKYISQAICETTEDPKIRRVIIEENSNLESIALKTESPSQSDIDNHKTLPAPMLPSRNLASEMDTLKSAISNATDLADLKRRIAS